MKTIITNGQIVTPDEIVRGSMTLENGVIAAVTPEAESAGGENEIQSEAVRVVDAGGCWVLPGFVDIHSDMIEGLLQPRSTAMMDFETGLREAEKQLAACGITTIFHSVSMFRSGSWDAKEIRTAPRVRQLAELVAGMKQKPHLIHNRYHLRYELDNLECYDQVLELIEEGKVQMLSLMDHRPGQGQYRNPQVYRRHLPSEGKNLTEEEFQQLMKREMEKPMVRGEKLSNLVKLAKERGIPVSSHDDDTLEKIRENAALGVAISEFPISLEVALAAKRAGIATLLGAPNILLGGSHSGNLSAEEAIEAGCAQILCSDYYPQALLRAVFYLAGKGILSLPEACRFVSKNPAEAAGIGAVTGSLEPGRAADFLLVSGPAHSGRTDEGPVLLETWVSGRRVLRLDYAAETDSELREGEPDGICSEEETSANNCAVKGAAK